MNSQEKEFFSALTEHRAHLAKALEDPALSGVRDSVVEKYSDQAHFVYELLQNADDAGATTARFVLEKNRLIFAHNGKRHFSITNPATEGTDSVSKTIGDINAITSIANSNKKGASIGKFGVGFKAVFQYTSTPYIYDPCFAFRIERFIVPVMLSEGFVGRKEDETLFAFPFDHQKRSPEECFDDISNKLRTLSYPLLFLSNLKNIEFSFDGTLGLYGKEIKVVKQFDDTEAEYIVLTQNSGEDFYEERLWLFSRVYNRGESVGASERYLKYSVGFLTDEAGRLRPVNRPAFCFFPTKEVTGLNFIIHAPFLLTDSREGIRAGVYHNNKMVSLLAVLAADAMVFIRDIGIEASQRLIDDSILSIIPTDKSVFNELADKSRISFLPFYQFIQQAFINEELLPAEDGYVKKENAYWAAIPQITQVFSNSQLSEIVENPQAKWVFTSLARDQRNRTPLIAYVDELVRTNLSEDVIINGRTRGYYRDGRYQNLESVKGIDDTFIENQPMPWLHEFYKWLSETKGRTDEVRNKAIFIDQSGKAAAAVDSSGEHILFLPVEGMDMRGYRVVNKELLSYPETKEFVLQMGVKEPSLKDQIYNMILPQYRDDSNGDIDTDAHFMMFFRFFCEGSRNEVESLMGYIRDLEFLTYYSTEDDCMYRGAANTMYFPSPDLKSYFEPKKETRFVDYSGYKQLVGSGREEQLRAFLSKVGVSSELCVLEQEIDYYTSQRTDLPSDTSTRRKDTRWHEWVLDGCKEIVSYIVENKDFDKSLVLWGTLLRVIRSRCSSSDCHNLSELIKGEYVYFFSRRRTKVFDSSDKLLLQQSAWIKTVDDRFVSPKEISVKDLAPEYETSFHEVDDLVSFLGIATEVEDNLTDDQRKKISLADQLIEAGIDEDSLKEIIKKFRRDGNRPSPKSPEIEFPDGGNNGEIGNTTPTGIGRVIGDIASRINRPDTSKKPHVEEPDEIIDEDEYTPQTVDFNKKIEQAKEKSVLEIEKITQYATLQEKALNAEKYSYSWFKTLLEMECLNSGENNNRSKEISIAFSKVEREPGTHRMLVLKHPNRYIPQFMEELADVPMVLHMADQTKTVAIEVASVKSYSLRVKMKSGKEIDGIDLSTVTSVTIDAKSPAFLLEELRKQFIELGYADDFNMQQNLCSNIEFVFGPPGTGKTTHLAKNVLLPMMQENREYKVLVLTPTNKSADVLVRRIMEVSEEDHSYNKWLVRFGSTSDESIEESPVFRDKTFDLLALPKSVTVTTIARFPYDFFMPEGNRYYLRGVDWDYIVIDEASMIPIANIVFPLYKKTPRKFIIAGDPFQIEPIASVDLWKDLNIYSMVHLDSFIDPKTVPYQYKVELLTTQYRSVPDLGYVFSNFAYGGILKHYRSAESQRQLNVGNDLGVDTLNIIKFPVSRYESIYRCKRLQNSSSYQIYAALFTFEYACYLARSIASNNPGQEFKIGIIAPYRAQSDLIEKLIASEHLPNTIDVQVGTIHGFQGDECDIIFAVFNPPPTISSSNEMFLNKRNIINVSISRARDYLFVVMPDDDTENISNLRLVKRVENLIKSTDVWSEAASPELEELIFGSATYLEDNTFSTSHQSVNVYGLPEKCYEVRTEDAAVDIQIHKPEKIGSVTPSAVVNDSYGLNEEMIPEELRRDAIDLPVQGALNGWFYLIPYEGKLSEYTNKPRKNMFVPVVRDGKEITISVAVVEEDRSIYMYIDSFRKYEQELSEPEGIHIQKTLIG